MSVVACYQIHHETRYEYTAEVVHAHHLLHLTPRETPHQSCSGHAIDIDPPPASTTAGRDVFGNPVTRLEFDRPHQRLALIADMTIAVHDRPVLPASETDAWEAVRERLQYVARPPGDEKLEACRFRMESPHARIKQAFTDYAAACFVPGRPVLEAANALNTKLHEEMAYAPGATDVATPLLEVLKSRRGVCQDYAHLMIACLRSHGLAARYVSGYLRTTPRAGAAPLIGADATHAWVAVFAPPIGWVELDPTNGISAGSQHVALAWGRDFSDVSPVRGVILGGGEHRLVVRVSVQGDVIP